MPTTKRRYQKDSAGRRKRFSPSPTGKFIVPRDMDVEIFKILQRYPYLSAPAIYELIPQDLRLSYQRFQKRMGDLFHETNTAHGDRYLLRPEEQRASENANYSSLIYSLAPSGGLALKDYDHPYGPSDLIDEGQLASFPHGNMVCEVLSSIEIGVQDDPDVELIGYRQILDKADRDYTAMQVHVSHQFTAVGKKQKKSFYLSPDALFGLKYKSGHRFFVLEAERKSRCNSKSIEYSSYIRKMLGYRYLMEKKRFEKYLGIPNLFVLSVGPQAHRVGAMKEVVSSLNKTAPTYLFRDIPVLGSRIRALDPSPTFYVDGWDTVSGTPFHLNKI